MLKTRIMPTLLHKDVGLVKGKSFDSWRRVGSAMQAIKVYNMREVDELVFLDIAATPGKRDPDYELIDDLADECFMPLAVGGGIRTADHIRRLLAVGADKVCINTVVVEQPEIVEEVARQFGSQCITVSIDARIDSTGHYQVVTHCGQAPVRLDPVDHAMNVEARGAGEIILTSIDRDGTMLGYDLNLTRQVSDAVTIPVIASGGAGGYQHMLDALTKGGATACAAASIFHFTEQTPAEAKRFLHENGIPVRST